MIVWRDDRAATMTFPAGGRYVVLVTRSDRRGAWQVDVSEAGWSLEGSELIEQSFDAGNHQVFPPIYFALFDVYWIREIRLKFLVFSENPFSCRLSRKIQSSYAALPTLV